MELTHKDVADILAIIDSAQNLDEIELTFSGIRLHVRRGTAGDGGGARIAQFATAAAPEVPQQAAPALRAVAQATPVLRAVAQAAEGEVIIRAPMLGTFYRASSPTEKAFVEVGQKVKADDSVGVIEVMKLFNSIQAGVDGTVVRIEVENASLVEFDQALIVIAKH